MSMEKTEEATPKRRQDERKKGNISKSQDLNSASVLIVGTCLLFLWSNGIMTDLKINLSDTFHQIASIKAVPDVIGFMMPYFIVTGKILIPFLFFLFIFAAFVVRIQVGSLFAIEKIKPKFDRLSANSIMQGLKRVFNIFDPKNLFELAKSFLKLLVVGFCGYSAVVDRQDRLFSLVGSSVEDGMIVLGDILFHMLINMCIAILILGFIDKKYQDYQYNKSLKMSKQEIKDEYKNAEGDPTLKSKIKAAQMNMRNQKMISAIPKADVVVTNPTHYAVAIKYDKINSAAPVVVAKGVDFMAFKIREIAKNNNVPIVENKPLARSLYKLVDINKMIPQELYTAVAEVLAWVYNKNRTGGR